MMGAARAAVAMLYAGVDDVRLLDGGLPAWRAAGFDVETTPRAPVAVAAFGGAVPLRPRLVVDKVAIRRMIDDPAGSVVVCTRSWAEHVGEISGYDAITARGRIRGSVWGHSGSDAHHVEDFEAPDGTLRDADELAALWAASGITGERHVAFYCGTGWRASLALFHAWRLGWPQASLYDPGWFEWAQDPAMPVETGPRVESPARRGKLAKSVNVAHTLLGASMVTWQVPSPVQAPLQPANAEPAAGVAVNTTLAPSVKFAAHDAPHAMPCGLDDTLPCPSPTFATTRLKLPELGAIAKVCVTLGAGL